MEKKEIIKLTIEDILKAMDFEGEVAFHDNWEENNLVGIKTNQANFLIGNEGSNLNALQHIVRVLVAKKVGESVPFILDVNDYRQNRIDYLKRLSENIAQKAMKEKLVVTLQPMPSFERRIIHTALSKYSQINTESIGEEPARKITIKASDR